MLNARTRLFVALVPAAMTFAVIALALASARALERAVGWVDHTRQVIDRGDAVLARAVDAETSQRGYLVTGDTGFLAPGHGALADVQQALGDLRRLTADNPVQQARLDTLDSELAERFRMLDSGITLRRSGNVGPLAKGDLLRGGRARMDHVRQILSAVKADEQRLLVQRRTVADQRLRLTTLVLLLGGLLAVATALGVNVLLNRIITEHEQMTRELGAQLEDLVAARRELAARAAPPPP
jgi:methyl-accepting chemotaxis protein